MELQELERRISELRPLLLCRTKTGREKIMSVEECVTSGAVYIRIVADDLDELLAAELGSNA